MSDVSSNLLLIFGLIVLVATAIDLLAARVSGDSLKAAAWWSVIWLAVGIGFTAVAWAQFGGEIGQQYLSGYLIERALSLDNLFVFSVLFTMFAVPQKYRGELLVAGIILAIILRAIFIFVGAGLLKEFWWMTLIFGAVLVYTGVKMLKAAGHVKPPKIVEKLAKSGSGTGFAALATCFVAIAITDIVFAIDSIPAVFAVTDDPYVVLAANVFALLGLRALYVVLNRLTERLPYLPTALALVLVVIGAKMMVSHWYHLPSWVSLVLVVGILGVGVIASLKATSRPISQGTEGDSTTSASTGEHGAPAEHVER